MLSVIYIGIGGFLGAIARYLLSRWVHHQFPTQTTLGTFIVNISGCFLLGIIISLMSEQELTGNRVRAFFLPGLIGAFTTLSALAYETLQLFQNKQPVAAISTALLNLIVGITVLVIANWAIHLLRTP